jgi:DNA modification methylase
MSQVHNVTHVPVHSGGGTLASLCVVCPDRLQRHGTKGDFRHDNHERSNRTTEQFHQPDPSWRLHRSDAADVSDSIDFVLTDPPYLVNYRDRTGRTIQNDADDTWLKPAMVEAYRVLKQNRVAIMFYGWTRIDAFFEAWRSAGFQPVGHIVFHKSYSSKSRFLRYQHEQAFLLAKGRPPLPKQPLGDVMEMPYSGNKLHPTQKPIPALVPLIRSFTLQGESVLDPFAGSGSTCAAAALTGRKYIGVEMDDAYFQQGVDRLDRVCRRIAAKRSSGVGIPTRV